MLYFHADVFCKQPMTGNGLTVIIAKAFPPHEAMQRMAQEFRQFETIFLVQNGSNSFDARIFTVEEELDFAGHPILGAAAVVQQEFLKSSSGIVFNLKNKQVSVTARNRARHTSAAWIRGRQNLCAALSQNSTRSFCNR